MATKNVLVRMLQNARIDSTDYHCNDLVAMPAKLAAAHQKAGTVDSDEDAVAFARDKLGAVPKEHVVPDSPATVSDTPVLQAAADAIVAAALSAQSAAGGQAVAQTQTEAVKPAAGAVQQ